jgi:hypothetical protein
MRNEQAGRVRYWDREHPDGELEQELQEEQDADTSYGEQRTFAFSCEITRKYNVEFVASGEKILVNFVDK